MTKSLRYMLFGKTHTKDDFLDYLKNNRIKKCSVETEISEIGTLIGIDAGYTGDIIGEVILAAEDKRITYYEIKVPYDATRLSMTVGTSTSEAARSCINKAIEAAEWLQEQGIRPKIDEQSVKDYITQTEKRKSLTPEEILSNLEREIETASS